MPGTTDEQPNWRRKLPVALEQLAGDPRVASLTATLSRLRPHPASRARARGLRRGCRAPPTGCSCTRTSRFDAGARHPALPGAPRREPCLLLTDPARPPGQHARLRHRRARRDQPRARRAPRASSALRRRLREQRHGPVRSTWCPTTWACWAPTTPGGWTCSRTARHPPTRSYFDIDWQPAERRARRQGAGAGAGRPLRRRAGQRRAGAAVRGRGRQLRVALLRAPLSAESPQLPGAAEARRGAAHGRGGTRRRRQHRRRVRPPAAARRARMPRRSASAHATRSCSRPPGAPRWPAASRGAGHRGGGCRVQHSRRAATRCTR